ncbi:MAG: hypothetical protein AAGE59_21770 [Cyanobacteria bacterium P01_F01_bin.86]
MELIFHPGNSLICQAPSIQRKAFEDRFSLTYGVDSTLVAVVIDGVGEQYVQHAARETYSFGGAQRVLGDIPGLVLMKMFEEVAKDTPSRLSSLEGIQGVIYEANETYTCWLKQHGLDDRLKQNRASVGGCTFAVVVVTPPTLSSDRQVLLVSAGDAIGVARTETSQVISTDNQLLTINSALKPIQNFLAETLSKLGAAHAHQDMQRIVFNAFTHKWQRNRLTNHDTVNVSKKDRAAFIERVQSLLASFDYLTDNQRHEIVHQLNQCIPGNLPGHGLFDGNPNVVQHLSMRQIPFAVLNQGTVIIATDGCIDERSLDQYTLCGKLMKTYSEHGIFGLANYNQSISKGPEATTVVLRLE